MLVLTFVLTQTARAQTFTTIHNFTGQPDGSFPAAPLTIDQAGNLYGTASLGGNNNCMQEQFVGCGTVFKLSRHGSFWAFQLLYTFLNPSDGEYPETAVVFGPDGALYGTTAEGGTSGCFFHSGCGTVFRLQPRPRVCPIVSCPWLKTTVYKFSGGDDGGFPQGSPSFDHAGNLYGTTQYTGIGSPAATVYELLPANGMWIFSIVFDFLDSGQAATPLDGVVFDAQGNMWATTYYGGTQDCEDPQLPQSCGILFELMRSESGWTERKVVQFDRSLGGGPTGNLVFDRSGNLYGTLQENGPDGGGSVFQVNPSNGNISILTSVSGSGDTVNGPTGNLVMDVAGNLYGVTEGEGANSCGSIFKLSHLNGGWSFADLHDFNCGSDGAYPNAGLAIDSNGNLYGTTGFGGSSSACSGGCGTVFELTQ